MNLDAWRMHYTYIIAAGVIAAGFGLIFASLSRIPPEAIIAFVVGTFTFALGFLFGREQTVGASRDAARAMEQGASGGVRPPEPGKPAPPPAPPAP
jgi:hypothetical protein